MSWGTVCPATVTDSDTLKFVINTVPCNMESDTQWSHCGPSMSTSGCFTQKRKQNQVNFFGNIVFLTYYLTNFDTYEAVLVFKLLFLCVLAK